MKRNIRKVAVATLLAFMLTGCGNSYPAAPELVKPAVSNEAYRPVIYGNVGVVDLYYGNVVPTDYCHFFKTSIKLEEICVDIGDYVNEGDVLAKADEEAVNKTIEELNAELSLENDLYTYNQQMYESKSSELSLRQKGATEAGNAEGLSQVNTEIEVLNENNRYDVLLHNYNVGRLQKKIGEQQELLDDLFLRARHSGYVTYVCDISSQEMVNNSSNVVVISDYDDTYIELEDMDVSDKNREAMEKYSDIYTTINGNKCELEEYSYSPNELIVMENKGEFARERLKLKNSAKLPEVGSNLIISMTKEQKENVLMIGNDSINEDGDGSFVYVKNGDEMKVRRVETGLRDKTYTEVISGLEEGDMVYYTSDAVPLEKYTECTVQKSDYNIKKDNTVCAVEDTRNKVIYSDYEGKIQSINVSDGDIVNKGDLICTINTNEGSARLTEMRNNMDSMKKSYQAQCSEINNNISALQEKVNQLNQNIQMVQSTPDPSTVQENKPADIATSTDAMPETPTGQQNPTTQEMPTGTTEEQSSAQNADESEEPQDAYIKDELQCQITQQQLQAKINEINYNYSMKKAQTAYDEQSCNNDGSGVVSIYAEAEGKYNTPNMNEGKTVKVGDKLFGFGIKSMPKIMIRTGDLLNLNQTVTVNINGEKKEGRIEGFMGSNGKYYTTVLDDEVFITQNSSESAGRRYYIGIDGIENYDTDAKGTSSYSLSYIADSIVVPKSAVYYESTKGSNDTFAYVWKVVDGTAVKQYVDIVKDSVDGSIEACVMRGLNEGDVIAIEEEEK